MMSDYSRAMWELEAPTRTLASAVKQYWVEYPWLTGPTVDALAAAQRVWVSHWRFVERAVRTVSERDQAERIRRDMDFVFGVLHRNAVAAVAALAKTDQSNRAAEAQAPGWSAEAPSDRVGGRLTLSAALRQQAAVESEIP